MLQKRDLQFVAASTTVERPDEVQSHILFSDWTYWKAFDHLFYGIPSRLGVLDLVGGRVHLDDSELHRKGRSEMPFYLSEAPLHLIPSATLRRFINSKASHRSCIIMLQSDEQLADLHSSTKEKSITSLRIRRATSIKAGKSSSTRHSRPRSPLNRLTKRSERLEN
ncbi:hypothetical protein TNCV_4074521 [Trichonephila clavipes]|uniref:Uncharacterized protein n=1 Tax=Trichonephila clavipes TaxID=2585209 RepID=A0A8X7BGY7_TRICX|nr:hypothetical protein TNCV_4074521 [Trichonephila clavipes]